MDKRCLYTIAAIILLVLFAVGGVVMSHAQDDFWMADIYPAPFKPYAGCPAVDGVNVTEDWVAWKRGENHHFDVYRQSLRFYEVDGVWMAEQRSRNAPSLLYVGWWWDKDNSKPNEGIFVGHASCGVYWIDPAG